MTSENESASAEDGLLSKIEAAFAKALAPISAALAQTVNSDDEMELRFYKQVAQVEMDLAKQNTADKGTSWDEGAARAAIKKCASNADGDVDMGKYGSFFLLPADDIAGCKLPVYTCVDGKKTLVPRAVAAAKQRLNQVQGISEQTRQRLATRLNSLSKSVGYEENTMKKSMDEDAELKFDLFTSDAPDRRNLIYGIVYKPNSVDGQKMWATPEVIEEGAHWFMKNSQMTDAQHQELNSKDDARIVENFITPQDIEFGGRPAPKGSWLMATEVSDRVFGAQQAGKYTGYSMKGRLQGVYGEAPPGHMAKSNTELDGILKLTKIRPTSVGFVTDEANGEPFSIVTCKGTGCPATTQETAMDKGATTVPGELPEQYKAVFEAELQKSLTAQKEEFDAKNEAMQKQVEEAMAKSAALENQNLLREMEAEAAKLNELPGMDGAAEWLLGIKQKAPDEYAKLEGALQAINIGMAKSKSLYREYGAQTAEPARDTPEGRIEEIADAEMAKSNDVSKPKARIDAWKANAGEYDKLRAKMLRREDTI